MTTSAAIHALPASAAPAGVAGWMRRHPLSAYFILAFALAWVFTIPIVLSQRGLGWVSLPDGLLLVLFLVATFSGPLPAALIMTRLTDGWAGVHRLLGRMVQWRAGLGWYLLVLAGTPLIFLAGASVYSGLAPWTALVANWPLLFSAYLPAALIGVIIPGLGEEPGWRGFALPRLQQRYGALAGSLILGALHALWHLPVYFVRGAIQDGPFDLTVFITNSLLIVAMTLVWTWLFNHAGQSVLFAMIVHGVNNAASGLIPQLVTQVSDPWFGVKVGAVCALVLVIASRGRLGYRPAPQQ
jgi:membrane protease YdiL (CAAX protease family)